MSGNDKKNFVWNTIGLSLYSFVSLFLLIAVKRINGMDQAGIFTYAFSLSTLFFYVALYYNRVYQVANYNNNKNFNQFLSMRLFTCVLAFVLILIFSLINKFDRFKITVILILMLFRICDAISDTFYGYEQENKLLYKSGISYTIKSIVGFGLFVILDYYTNNLIFACIILSFINFLFLGLYDLNNYKKISKNKKIKIDFSNYKMISKEAFPIFIFSFLSVYLVNSQKFILNYYVTNDLQTVFGVLIMPATLLSLVGSYLIMPFVSNINDLYKKKNIKGLFKLCNKILLTLFIIGVICIIGCYFVGIPVLNIIYNLNLWEYRFVLELVIVGSVFCAAAMILSNILIIMNDNKVQIIIYLLCGIISSIISVLFINYIGIKGAIYSYLISYIIVFVMYFVRYVFDIIKFKGDAS